MNLFSKLPRDNEVRIGEKRVQIKKLTPVRWRELFGTIETLPNLILQVLAAPKEDKRGYILAAIDEGLDEVCEVVAMLSGLDSEYVKNEVGLDEIIEYLAKTAKYNRLGDAIKNTKSLLGQ